MSLKLPNIPSLPSNVDASVRRAFDSLRSWFAEVTKKGGLLDRMSGEELVDELLPSEWTDGAIPPKPQNLEARGGFATISLVWDDPHYLSLAHAEVWRSTTDSLADAQMVGTTAAPMYLDTPPRASLSVTYWYWVRFISKAGIAGPFSDPASAHTADDPEYVLEILTNQITASELDKSLSERINLIDLPETGLWDRMMEAEAELDVAMANIGEITTDDFDENETYNVGRLVKHEGKIYRSIKDINDTPAPLPTDTEYWKLVGEYASLSDMLAATAYGLSTIDARTDNAEDELIAHTQQITALEATVDNPATGVVATRALLLSDYSTTATTNSAIVSAKNAAIATANGNTATQLQSYYTKSETDSAVTIAKNAAIASAGNNLASTIAEYTNTADMTQAITEAKESAISSANGNIAGLLTSYTTTTGMNDAITSAQNNAISTANGYTATQLQSYYTKTAADSAVSSAINQLQVNTLNGMSAAIATEQLVRATSTGPDWKINENYYTGNVVVRNNALYQAQSNHYSSNANGPPNATYWKPVTSNLYAQHMVKVDNNGYVAGYGLANDGISSQFRVRADTFSIGSPGRPDVTPFVVDTQKNRVVMSSALVADLTATIASGKLLTYDHITGGTADFTSLAKMAKAQIGAGIESTNYVPGVMGWRINGNGDVEFSNGVFRGDVEATSIKANRAIINGMNIYDYAIETRHIADNAVTSVGTTPKHYLNGVWRDYGLPGLMVLNKHELNFAANNNRPFIIGITANFEQLGEGSSGLYGHEFIVAISNINRALDSVVGSQPTNERILLISKYQKVVTDIYGTYDMVGDSQVNTAVVATYNNNAQQYIYIYCRPFIGYNATLVQFSGAMSVLGVKK